MLALGLATGRSGRNLWYQRTKRQACQTRGGMPPAADGGVNNTSKRTSFKPLMEMSKETRTLPVAQQLGAQKHEIAIDTRCVEAIRTTFCCGARGVQPNDYQNESVFVALYSMVALESEADNTSTFNQRRKSVVVVVRNGKPRVI
jgi:hypothetical protein